MYVGVDIGGTNTKVGIISRLGRVVNSSSFKTNAPVNASELIEQIASTINVLLQKERMTLDDIRGIGIGIPGVVNSDKGIIVRAANLGWTGVDFLALLKQKFSKVVRIDNDANCAAFAESKFGGGKEYENLIFITLGTGIGSGIILNGKLYEGNGCAGGECGHMIIKINGEDCPCGSKGCWERYASASALTRRTAQVANENPKSKLNDVIKKYNNVSAVTAFEAARSGDVVAKKLVDEYIDYVNCGLINLTQIFHPQAFIIGGGVSNEGSNFIKPLQQRLNNFIMKNNIFPLVEVKKAILGNEAGMIGAACLVME